MIRQLLRRLLPDVGSKCRSALAFRALAKTFVGKAKNSTAQIKMTYIGNGGNLSFCKGVLFDQVANESVVGKCNIWNAGRLAERMSSTSDVVIVDVPWPYDVAFADDRHMVELPSWVRQEIDVETEWESVVRKWHRNVRGAQMRKIRKNCLTYTTTSAPDAVDSFYEAMYVPHVKRRFGSGAHVDSKDAVHWVVKNGALLQILKDRDTIAACALHRDGAALRVVYIGFAADELRKIDGASAALYYYSQKYAFENKLIRIDFCGSRPLPFDGVYRTKRSWGAATYDDWALESLLLKFNNFGPGVRSFFENNPLIVRDGETIIAKALVGGEKLSAESLKKTVHALRSPGLAGLKIYCAEGMSEDALSDAENCSAHVELFDLRDCGDALTVICDL